MSKIIPTILASTKKKFLERLKKIVPVSEKIQIDIMDGRFVPKRSVRAQEIPSLYKYGKTFEAHLMVNRPSWYISKFKKKGFTKIIFHIESRKNHEEILKTINEIKLNYMVPCIAINPKTPVKKVFPYLTKVRQVLIMGVNPGKEGQKLKSGTLQKIKELRKKDSKLKIQIDGGVNSKTASKLAKAGCNYLNTGSFVSEAEDPKAAIKTLEKEFEKGLK